MSGIYVGVDGKARKVQKAYVGIATEEPVYQYAEEEISISESNIENYFLLSRGGRLKEYSWDSEGYLRFKVYNTSSYSDYYYLVLTPKYDVISTNFDYACDTPNSTMVFYGGEHSKDLKGNDVEGSLSFGELPQYGEFCIRVVASGNSATSKYSFEVGIRNIVVKMRIPTICDAKIKREARKVYKSYVGVGGKARPNHCPEEIAYYGKLASLTPGTYGAAAVSTSNYAAIFGGYGSGTTVYAYSKTLERTTPGTLSVWRENLSAATINDSYIIASPGSGEGGYSGDECKFDIFDKNFTRNTIEFSHRAYGCAGAAGMGTFAIFSGKSKVVMFDSSLCYTEIDVGNYFSNTISIGTEFCGHAVFTGKSAPYNNFSCSNLFLISEDFVVKRARPRKYRESWAMAKSGNYLLIAASTSSRGKIEVYNKNFVRCNEIDLCNIYGEITGTTIRDFALFAGGYAAGTNDNLTNYVEVVNPQLVVTSFNWLSEGKRRVASTAFNDYVIFGGGINLAGSNRQSNVVEAIKVM